MLSSPLCAGAQDVKALAGCEGSARAHVLGGVEARGGENVELVGKHGPVEFGGAWRRG